MSLCDPLADARLTWAGKREAMEFVDIRVRIDGMVEFRPLNEAIARLEPVLHEDFDGTAELA